MGVDWSKVESNEGGKLAWGLAKFYSIGDRISMLFCWMALGILPVSICGGLIDTNGFTYLFTHAFEFTYFFCIPWFYWTTLKCFGTYKS